MSHFNLGGGAQRRKFIGPQHRLASRPTSSTGIATNLENIGGRIMVENEMIHHKLRMREVKPSVDTGMPWAHKLQFQQSHPGAPVSAGGGSVSRVAQRIQTAAESDRQWTASAGGTGSRPTSASQGRPASAAYHPRPAGASSSRTTPAGGHAAEAFDVSTLSPDHQLVYRDMLRVLCTLEQSKCKMLLEHMYREAEDKKLLMGYTGVFPTDTDTADGALS